MALALDADRERFLNHYRLDGFQDCLALGQRETERRESNACSLETSNLVHLLLVADDTPELDFELHTAARLQPPARVPPKAAFRVGPTLTSKPRAQHSPPAAQPAGPP
jgi:hypothetical protein